MGCLVFSAWSDIALVTSPPVFRRVQRACVASAARDVTAAEMALCCVQVLAGMVVGEFMYPLCAVWTFVHAQVEWSGVVYTRSNGKICKVRPYVP